MSFFKGSSNRTIITILIAAILISAAVAGGKWGVGFAETIPIVTEIDPSVVHVNSISIEPATITGGDFVGVLYTKVFFKEPDGTEHEFVPETVDDCDPENEYKCSTLTVNLPDYLFLNVGVAEIWVINYDEYGDETGRSVESLYISIIDELYLPIIMKSN